MGDIKFLYRLKLLFSIYNTNLMIVISVLVRGLVIKECFIKKAVKQRFREAKHYINAKC